MWRLMVWPKSERRQAEATATWAAQMLAFRKAWPEVILQDGMELGITAAAKHMGVTPAEVLSMPHARDLSARLVPVARGLAQGLATRVETELFEPAGGLQRVAAAPGADALAADIKRALERGALASGVLLATIASIHQHNPSLTASLNRGVAVLEILNKRLRSAVSFPRERAMKHAWVEWRGVAPLWAAAWLDAADGRFAASPPLATMEGQFADPARRRRILSWAGWFRDFATTHVAPNASRPEPLIPAVEAVAIETSAEPAVPPVGPIPADVLSAARQARGWKR
jgi:hypothetical protein